MQNAYSIAPWLSVQDSLQALEFYKQAFGAVESYRLDIPDGVIARLSIHGAEFWIADASSEQDRNHGGGIVRMILSVPDPDTFFSKALLAGAITVNPVSEEHGWRVGRLVDPFGHHWEIGREVKS
jgi:PhnB protein